MSGDQQGVYVDLDYEMDPQFDVLLRGGQLRDGMVVLVDSSLIRVDIDRINDPSDKYARRRARENNRWCTVTELTVTRRYDEYGPTSPLISFIGLYADGTQMARTFDSSYTWLVKKDSIAEDAA